MLVGGWGACWWVAGMLVGGWGARVGSRGRERANSDADRGLLLGRVSTVVCQGHWLAVSYATISNWSHWTGCRQRRPVPRGTPLPALSLSPPSPSHTPLTFLLFPDSAYLFSLSVFTPPGNRKNLVAISPLKSDADNPPQPPSTGRRESDADTSSR